MCTHDVWQSPKQISRPVGHVADAHSDNASLRVSKFVFFVLGPSAYPGLRTDPYTPCMNMTEDTLPTCHTAQRRSPRDSAGSHLTGEAAACQSGRGGHGAMTIRTYIPTAG